ncbi:MAG TPA: hypothetical protein VGM07_19010 [Stellaceae bacterium]|jgi:hypothetical protein
MPSTVFFSWQADASTRDGRNFIERALKKAAERIGNDATVEEAVRELSVDRDTKGVPGSPPIVETIFRKIDQAAVFVPDLTFVGRRADGRRPTPNPNVLIEYGWALKSLGHGRIVPVMNTAFGEPTAESMPFNLHHLRHPITYHCSADADNDTRRRVRERLAKELEGALQEVLTSEEFAAGRSGPPASSEFSSRTPEDGLGRFRARGQPLGVNDRGVKVHLAEGPVVWFRLMPTFDPGRMWTIAEIRKSAYPPRLLPLDPPVGDIGSIRNDDGCRVDS